MSPVFRIVSLAVLASLGCGRAPAPGLATLDLRHTTTAGGTPVATWTGDRVTAEELERRLRELPPAQRERYQTLEEKREYVEGMARFELLVREAVARGLLEDPEVVASTKRALVSRLMHAQLDEATPPVTDAEVAAAYERQKEDFVRPAQVRLAHVFLAAPRADVAKVAQAREKAERVLAQARALPPGDADAFGRLARTWSEEPRTQPLDGDLRFRALGQLAQDLGPEVAEATRALLAQGPGALSGVVQTDAGLHVLRLTASRPELHQSLEEARPQLAGQLAQQKRSRAWSELVTGLAQQADFSVDSTTLSRVHVDPNAPARPASGPPPGTLPPPFSSAQVSP